MTSSLAQGTMGSSAQRLAAMYPLSGRQNDGNSKLAPELLYKGTPGPPSPELVYCPSVGGGSRLKQPTEAIAAATAKMWSQNPNNAMLLPEKIRQADADGDGTIDRDEFANLLQQVLTNLPWSTCPTHPFASPAHLAYSVLPASPAPLTPLPRRVPVAPMWGLCLRRLTRTATAS
jgi:hypothetical protein